MEWVRLPVELIQQKKVTLIECAVLALIIDREGAELTVKEMAQNCGVSDRTVQATLKSLQEKGYISISREQGQASVYKLLQDILPPKQRGNKQKQLEAELRTLQKEAELKKLKDQIQAEKDIDKYSCVINKF